MSKYIIRVRGNDYPYFTDALEETSDGRIQFLTENPKSHKCRKITLNKDEIISQEEEIEGSNG